MNLGFVGLGHLGRAIAERLLDCGHSLAVWNRTPGKAQGLGVSETASLYELTHSTEIIFACLFDSKAVREVLTRQDGLLSGDVAGKIVVDVTTNHFRDVLAFHDLCKEAGCQYLEAPVLGSVVPASQGALTVLISGEKTAFEKARSVLEDVGKHLFYLSEPGLATKMKLINNLTLGSFMATIAEALVLGEEIGLAKKKVLDILSAGGGNSLVLNAKKNALLTEDFTTQFSNALIYKDLHCLQDLAYERQIPIFMAALSKELYAKACSAGRAQDDFSSIFSVLRQERTR